MTWRLTFRHVLGELRVELSCWWVEVSRQREHLDDVYSILTRQFFPREQSGREREVQRCFSDLKQQLCVSVCLRASKLEKEKETTPLFWCCWLGNGGCLIFRLKTKTVRAERGIRHGVGITWERSVGWNKTREINVTTPNIKSIKPLKLHSSLKKWIESKLLKQRKNLETQRHNSPFSDQLVMNLSHSMPSIRKMRTPWTKLTDSSSR